MDLNFYKIFVLISSFIPPLYEGTTVGFPVVLIYAHDFSQMPQI